MVISTERSVMQWKRENVYKASNERKVKIVRNGERHMDLHRADVTLGS